MSDETAAIETTGDEPSPAASKRTVRRVVAVGGGKGGSGKSLIAANVAIFLATLGKKVVLFDADLGGANLHTFVGVERPRVTLADFLQKRIDRIDDVVVETTLSGLGLVSGEGGPPWMANPKPAQKFRVINQLSRLEADFLVMDLGPGSGFNALDFFNVADIGVLVVLPEPTSIENTHRFIKSAFIRQLKKHGLGKLAEISLVRDIHEGGIPAPRDLLEAAETDRPEDAARLLEVMRGFRPRIVVNQVRTRSDAELGPALVAAARRRLGVPVDYLGHLEHDDAAWAAIRRRRPLLVEHPESRVSKGIERLARRLLSIDPAEQTGSEARSLDEQTHYEVLGVDPSYSDEEIRRTYRRAREIYAPDSMVVSGLYNPDRLENLHLRVEEAYATLMDPERRKAYDRETFPEGLPPRDRVSTPPGRTAVSGEHSGKTIEPTPETEAEAAERPPEPDIGPDTPVTGALLQQFRQARGIDIFAVSETTKISMSHLRDMEDERFDRLPAPVYVRGYLKSFARVMGMPMTDSNMSDYMQRFAATQGRDAEGE